MLLITATVGAECIWKILQESELAKVTEVLILLTQLPHS